MHSCVCMFVCMYVCMCGALNMYEIPLAEAPLPCIHVYVYMYVCVCVVLQIYMSKYRVHMSERLCGVLNRFVYNRA